jgi:hypothetical protein
MLYVPFVVVSWDVSWDGCHSFFNADVSASARLCMSLLSTQCLMKLYCCGLSCVYLAACGQCDGERVWGRQEGKASPARLRYV